MLPSIGLGGFARSYVKWLFLFSVVVNLLLLATPLHMLQIYDRVLSSGSVPTLLYLTAIILIVLCMGGFADYCRRLIAQKFAARYTSEASDTLLKALVSPARDDRGGSKVLREFALVRSFMASRTFISLFDLPFTPFFLLFMFLLNIWLGLIVLVGLAIMLGLGYLNKKATAPDQATSRKAESDAMGYASASLQHSEEMRAMGMIPAFQQRWGLKLLQSMNSMDNAGRHMSAFASGSKLLRQALQVIVISCGAFLVLSGDMSGGMIFAASMITNRVLSPVDQLIGGWDSIVRARSAYESVTAIIDSSQIEEHRLQLPDPKGHLAVEQVCFQPQPKRTPILRDVSFEIKPGELVVVTGPSGAGKSTLARILSGALQPTSGTVRLSGTEQDHWPVEQWGETIGYVAQDFNLLPATVAENIARLSYGFDEEKLLAASRRAGVHEMISSLPDGYNTKLGEGRFRLSGGQKQRIALARALYGSPKLLVLDEPDANLDREGMKRLIKALDQMKRTGTAILIASHRTRLLDKADKVLTIEDGIVKEKSRSRKSAASTTRKHRKPETVHGQDRRSEPKPTPNEPQTEDANVVALSDLDRKFEELRRLSAKSKLRTARGKLEAV